ncbi:hypothetical protein GCM10027447_02110 [Glycomyces halotolerans]
MSPNAHRARPPVPYFGGKQSLAQRIVELFPPRLTTSSCTDRSRFNASWATVLATELRGISHLP